MSQNTQKNEEISPAVNQRQSGFSVLELMIAMTLILSLMAAAMSVYSGAFRTRARESSRTDALISARAAINIITQEISNSGYGLLDGNNLPANGIVTQDSTNQRFHFRANVQNNETVLATDDEGEDITYYYDTNTKSILRYDPRGTPSVSTIINRISNVNFEYFDYVGVNSTPTQVSTPTADTSRVRVTVTVELEEVFGQPAKQIVTLRSEVVLRNSRYMLNQY